MHTTLAEYTQVLERLVNARRSGIDFGLSRVKDCIATLNCAASLGTTIQIAGTNGKGSTAAFTAAYLRHTGRRVGVFSSPHLLSLRERFTIDGAIATQQEVIQAYRAVQAATTEQLSFFEQVTVMAAWLFARAKVDVAIFEVGLGGRLDSTTALPADICAVAGIAMDHCEFLGHSLAEIADEKAGIFRPNVPAIIGLSAPGAIRERLADRALEVAARPVWVDAKHRRQVPNPLRMRGEHQRQNAALAVAILSELGPIDPGALHTALSNVVLAGRYQEVVPGLWIDGAHNGQAAQTLADTLPQVPNRTLIVGMSASKDIDAFLRPLLGTCTQLIATEATNDRAQQAVHIANRAQSLGFSASAEPDLATALQRGRGLPGPVLVTGSLLLLGESLGILGVRPVDPILITDPSHPSSHESTQELTHIRSDLKYSP